MLLLFNVCISQFINGVAKGTHRRNDAAVSLQSLKLTKNREDVGGVAARTSRYKPSPSLYACLPLVN